MSPPRKTTPPGPDDSAGARWLDAQAEAARSGARAQPPLLLGPAQQGGEGAGRRLGSVVAPDAAPGGPSVPMPERIGLEGDAPATGAAPPLGVPDLPVTGGAAVVEALRSRGALAGEDGGSGPPPGRDPASGDAPGEAAPERRRRRARKRRLLARPLVWAFDIAVLGVVVVILAVLLMAGRELPAPDWLAARVEARVNEGLGGARAEIGGLYVIFRRTALPRVILRDVELRAEDGTHIVHVPALRTALDKGALMSGQIQPRSITISGAQMRAARDAQGRIDLRLGDGALGWEGADSLAGLLEAVDRVLALPSFAPIERIVAEDLVLEFADARSGREWVLHDGRLEVEQDAHAISARLALQLSSEAVRRSPQEEDARAGAQPGQAGQPGGGEVETAEGPDGPLRRSDSAVIPVAGSVPRPDDASAPAKGPATTSGRGAGQGAEERVAGGGGPAADDRVARGADTTEGDDAPAVVVLNFTSQKGSTAAELSARVEGVAAQDLAAQIPATAFLSLLDAPISGAMRARVDEAGALSELAGQLEIGSGFIEPGQGQAPVRLDGGRSYFYFQPEESRLVFDELRLAARDVSFTASGRAYLEGMEDSGWPSDLVGQLRFSQVRIDPTGVFEEGAEFGSGALDLKLSLDPLRLRIGQMVLEGEDVTLRATGGARPVPEGWEASIDLDVERIGHERLLALWPVELASKTRDWIAERVVAGELFNVSGALRARPGEDRPLVSLVYEFRDAEVLPLPTLPPIRGASGYSSISDDSYTMSLDSGHIDPPEGGRIDVAGSVLRVPDVRRNPADMEIKLVSRSSGTAVLSLLDQEPWRFLSKAGQPVDIAEAQAALEGVIRFPLIKDVPGELIDFRIRGVLSDVRSQKVVPGRELTARRLDVTAHGEEIAVSGPGRIEGLPITATWVQPIGKPGPQPSRVEGTIELSQAFVDRFNIGLPDGMVTGQGRGQFAIDLARGQAPRFSLRSDLNNVGLSIRELAWSMGRGTKGSLQVSGQLGEPPVIDRLALTAPGFSAEGRVTLNPGGGLKTAAFSRVKAGQWIDAPVTLSGRGKGATPAVSVNGGWVDVRRTAFAQGGGASASAGAPMRLALDRLIVSDSIALRDFRAELSTRGGLNGRFSGNVNGAAPVSGSVVPIRGKTAVRMASQDAGRVFRAAGLFRKGRGGTMELTLTPRREPGQYNGDLKVKNVRVQSAPGLAALLNAISVVGLIEQMSGPGILLSNTQVDFRLTPNAVQITEASAVGPSLGISMAGVYDMARDRMQLQGVFSPIYVINGIGQIFSKRGEGLFGFNYKMTGPAASPKVSVNPLSVLTPGIFREIFRQPPPRLQN